MHGIGLFSRVSQISHTSIRISAFFFAFSRFFVSSLSSTAAFAGIFSSTTSSDCSLTSLKVWVCPFDIVSSSLERDSSELSLLCLRRLDFLSAASSVFFLFRWIFSSKTDWRCSLNDGTRFSLKQNIKSVLYFRKTKILDFEITFPTAATYLLLPRQSPKVSFYLWLLLEEIWKSCFLV